MTDASALVDEADELLAKVNGHPENVPSVRPRLLEMLAAASEPEVLVAVIDALGKAWDEASSLATLPYSGHPDERVRLAVAQAAAGGASTLDGETTVALALIPLTRDTSSEVRSWATFGIGTMTDVDLPEIRLALADRLDDDDVDTRCEAVVGLAERGDPRAFEPTVELLRADVVYRLAVVAAATLADARLLDDLRDLESWWDVDPEALQEAIDACAGTGPDGRVR